MERLDDKEKENFELRHELYQIKKKQGGAASSSGGVSRLKKSGVKVKGGSKGQEQKEQGSEQGPRPELGEETSADSMSREILSLHSEKDDLLRRISDLETELLQVKEEAAGKPAEDKVLSAIHIDEARKKERKAFQTLAAHDAALLKKFEAKTASLCRQRESMKSIIDELSNKVVIYVETLQEKEMQIQKDESERGLLQRELQSVKDRNTDLLENLREMSNKLEAIEAQGQGHAEQGMLAHPSSDAADNIDNGDNDEDEDGNDAASGVSDISTVRTIDSIPSARQGGGERGGGPVNSTMILSTPGTIKDGDGGVAKGGAATTTNEDDDDNAGLGRGNSPLSPPLLRSDLSRISTGEGGAGYHEDAAALHESIRAIVAGKESAVVEGLRVALREREELMREQERSFESVITRAQETTLLEAEEIARLERELEESRIEARTLARTARLREQELGKAKNEKRLLEDMLIDNEASAVNKAMAVLNQQSPALSAALARPSSRGAPVSGGGATAVKDSPPPAATSLSAAAPMPAGRSAVQATPGALSTQDMADLLHAQAQAAGVLGEGPGQGQARGQGQGLRIDTQLASSEHASDGLGAGMGPGAGRPSSSENAESILAREKEEEVVRHREREAQLMNALEGVLGKYSALERRLNYNQDNRKRSAGMKF